jgi:hypothetical protein
LVPISLLSHLAAALPGATYFFRDFGITFYPMHRFWGSELAAGRWPFWNPYVQEGLAAFPITTTGYPLDVLHGLWHGPAAVSFLLTLHFPLAALGAYALARELGTRPRGALASGATFALGGLAVSSLNLYVFLQALAWAPWVVLYLRRAATRGGRQLPAAAFVLALAFTTALEFIAQALLVGLVVGAFWEPGRWRLALARMLLAVALGAALAAVPLSLVIGVLPETIRGGGLSVTSQMDYQVHPAVLVQVLIRDFFGSIASPIGQWWGQRFFPNGFPYFVTLYIGAAGVALAASGLGGFGKRQRHLLAVLAILGVWYALGTWGGLAPLVAPLFSMFRNPSKALLLPHLIGAVLVGRGLDRLGAGEGWPVFRAASLAAAATALAVGAAAAWIPDAVGTWMESDPRRDGRLQAILASDCLATGLVACAQVWLAVLVLRRSARPVVAAAVAATVLVLDLARGGAGVNPQTSPAFFSPLPGIQAERLDALEGGRVFSYGVDRSPAMRHYLAREGALAWAYYAKRQVLSPHANVGDRVEGGPIADPGFFLFRPPELRPWEWEPRFISSILPRLRNAAVSRILSLDPLDSPELRLRAVLPVGPTGLAVHVYEVRDPWPRRFVACRAVVAASQVEALNRPRQVGYHPAAEVALEEPVALSCHGGSVRVVRQLPSELAFDVEADGQGLLVLRDNHARGWRATVDGRPARVLRANGKHRGIPIPAGRHHVVMTYDAPGFGVGLAVMAIGVALAVGLWLRPILGRPTAVGSGQGDPSPGPEDPGPGRAEPRPR